MSALQTAWLGRRSFVAWTLGAVLLSLLVDIRPARSAPPTRDQLKKLLELGWQIDPESQQAAAEFYDELSGATRGHSSVLYAQTLIKVKQRRYADALPLVDDLLRFEPKNIDAWRAKIWLSIILRRSPEALVATEKAVALFPPEPDDPAAAGDAERYYVDLSTFLGRMFGYLEGPGATTVGEAQLANHRTKVVERLTGSRREAFLAGRDAVVDQFLGRKDDQQVTREKTIQEEEKQRDQRLQQLDEQRSRDKERVDQLNAERTRLRGELNDQLRDIQQRDRPLADQFARLDAQAARLRRELNVYAADIDQLERLLLRERDPVIRDQYRRELAVLESRASRLDADLATLNRQGAGIASQRAALVQESQQVQASIGRQLDSLDKEGGDIQRRGRQAESEERRLRKPTTGDSTQVRAMSAQAQAWTTYEPFPLELERQRLLDSLK